MASKSKERKKKKGGQEKIYICGSWLALIITITFIWYRWSAFVHAGFNLDTFVSIHL
jgi:hypothetical protein